MKTRLTGATFDASEKTITHASFSDVTLAGIQLITNVTDQIIIYNFADTAKGGTLSADTLTLEYDTTSMSDTDELMILVEDGSASTAINDGGNTITVDGTVSVTGVSTSANQTTIIGHLDGVEGLLTTIDADTGTIATEVAGLLTDAELRATPVPVSGTVTVTATNLDVQSGGADLATSTQAGAIQTSVELIDDTVYTDGTGTVTKGIAILGQDGTNPQAIKTDASGELQVDVLSMPTTAVTGTFWQATQPVSLTSTTVTGTVAVTQSGTWDEVGINDSGNSITVDYATTGSGTATGALRVELPTNGTGVIATVGAVTAITNALPAGTNAIGKLSANSGVDIGDVDVTSISAGSNLIGDVSLQPRTGNGLTIFRSIDLDETEEEIKATAGNLYAYYFANTNASARYLKLYNATAANVTVGTTTPVVTFYLPPTSAGHVGLPYPIGFSTAISAAATTGVADNDTGAPGANEVIFNAFYK